MSVWCEVSRIEQRVGLYILWSHGAFQRLSVNHDHSQSKKQCFEFSRWWCGSVFSFCVFSQNTFVTVLVFYGVGVRVFERVYALNPHIYVHE